MSTDTPSANPLPVDTGIPGLDQVLRGGLVRDGLYLVEGRAGSGKTILAGQVTCHRARMGERVLFITLLAEFHAKLLGHLRTLSFFDDALFANSVQLLSGFESLASGGTDGLLKFVASSLHDFKPALLVIDGFRSIRRYTRLDTHFCLFVHELNTLVTTTHCTTLAVGGTDDEAAHPEHALVDGIIELGTWHGGMRRGRYVEVHKTRASSHLRGLHTMRIDAAGLHVYPRLEALLSSRPMIAPASSRRVPFGIDTLDDMIGGGLVEGSSTRILGAPGIGKTLLCLQFLDAGARINEKGLYFGFYEAPDRLLHKATAVSMNVATASTDGRLRFQWQPPLEYSPDELGERLLSLVREGGFRRVVLDGISGFRDSELYPERYPHFALALTLELRSLNVTTLFTEELEPLRPELAGMSFGVSALVENLLVMNYVEIRSELRRLICVMKLRDSDFDPGIREFIIANSGLRVGATFGGIDRVLAGQARTLPAGRAPARAQGRKGRKGRSRRE